MNPSKTTSVMKYEAGNLTAKNVETIIEAPVSLTVNGEFWLTFMCTPDNLEALAIGFLFNEGIISKKEDVADARVCEHGDNIDVWTNSPVQKPKKWTRTSGCTGGVTSLDADDNLSVVPTSGLTLTPQRVFSLLELLSAHQKLYKETGGVHTSALSDGEGLLFSAEDIGRHNTLDKIAGLNLLSQFQSDEKTSRPESRVLITTGRISSEMLQKSARMGAEIVISRTSPSSLSITMAEKRGITLIGYARGQRFSVYTHAQRVVENL